MAPLFTSLTEVRTERDFQTERCESADEVGTALVNLPVVICQYKNELGAGGTDATLQAGRDLLETLA